MADTLNSAIRLFAPMPQVYQKITLKRGDEDAINRIISWNLMDRGLSAAQLSVRWEGGVSKRWEIEDSSWWVKGCASLALE